MKVLFLPTLAEDPAGETLAAWLPLRIDGALLRALEKAAGLANVVREHELEGARFAAEVSTAVPRLIGDTELEKIAKKKNRSRPRGPAILEVNESELPEETNGKYPGIKTSCTLCIETSTATGYELPWVKLKGHQKNGGEFVAMIPPLHLTRLLKELKR